MMVRLDVCRSAVLATGVACYAIFAGAQGSSLPDAQVEANVLRSLAAMPELATQNIQSSTVYGTVTLSGNVHDETMRTRAENLVSRTSGVKKVIDELTLGDVPPPSDASVADAGSTNAGQGTINPPAGEVLQSDGTYAAPPPASPGDSHVPASQSQADSGGYGGQSGGEAQNAAPEPGYTSPPAPGYDPSRQVPAPGRQPLYSNGNSGNYPAPPAGPNQGGQAAGLAVTIPAGAMLRIRINRGLDSNHIQPGATFDGTVLTDVVADGAVAVPRGAAVQGLVVDAKKAGVFKGEGELSLQISSLTLGGQVYPVVTDVWQRSGRDKTAGTVNRTVGLGALGAVFGGLAGGGAGAAVGAGVGGAVGLAGSAASPRGQIIIPPESVLSFRTVQPAPVRTVSEAEMARLSYAAGPSAPVRRYNPYYGPNYGPPTGPENYR